MTRERKAFWLHHLASMVRDILTICAVLGGIIGIGVTAMRPYWAPFAALPEQVQAIQQDIAATQDDLATLRVLVRDNFRPQIVEFNGRGLVADKAVLGGGALTITYHLRRNASCDTTVTPQFFGVDTGVTVNSDPFLAAKAPVSDGFGLFTVRIPVPDDLPPGRYVYRPIMSPIDCRPYGEMAVIPSDIFEVIEQ